MTAMLPILQIVCGWEVTSRLAIVLQAINSREWPKTQILDNFVEIMHVATNC